MRPRERQTIDAPGLGHEEPELVTSLACLFARVLEEEECRFVLSRLRLEPASEPTGPTHAASIVERACESCALVEELARALEVSLRHFKAPQGGECIALQSLIAEPTRDRQRLLQSRSHVLDSPVVELAQPAQGRRPLPRRLFGDVEFERSVERERRPSLIRLSTNQTFATSAEMRRPSRACSSLGGAAESGRSAHVSASRTFSASTRSC